MSKADEKIILRNAKDIQLEDAHGKAGKRRVIFSGIPKSKISAVTIGYLPKGGVFDWHMHDDLDEIMFIMKGKVLAESRTQKLKAEKGSFIFFPHGIEHRQSNIGSGELVAEFMRIKI